MNLKTQAVALGAEDQDHERQQRYQEDPTPNATARGLVGALVKWHPETIGVLDTDDGRSLQLHRFGMDPIGIDPLPANVGDLALHAAEYDLGQIWVTWRAACGPLNLPQEVNRQGDPVPHPFGVMDLMDATVEPSHGALTSWYTLRWTDNPTGRISIVLPHLDTDAPWREAKDGHQLLRALILFREMTDSHYYWSVGSTASGIASKAYPNLRKRWHIKGVEHAPADECHAVSSCALTLSDPNAPGRYRSPIVTSWTRRFGADEEVMDNIYTYDCNAAFLGALGGTVLGRGEPVHWRDRDEVVANITKGDTVQRLSRASMAGYFRLVPPVPWHPNLPGFHFPDPNAMWVTHPILEWLYKQDIKVRIEEAYVWPQSLRPFETMQDQISKGRAELVRELAMLAPEPGEVTAESLALDAVKSLYSVFYTWIGRRERMSDKGLWRPDWSHFITDGARIAHWYRVASIAKKSNRWPVAMRTDEIAYTSDAASHAEAAPAGLLMPDTRAVGTWKPARWVQSVTVRENQGEHGGKFWNLFERKAFAGERV